MGMTDTDYVKERMKQIHEAQQKIEFEMAMGNKEEAQRIHDEMQKKISESRYHPIDQEKS